MNSNLLGVALGILGACAALLIFPPLFERIAGWPQLLARFDPSPANLAGSLGYASLGRVITIPVRLGASPQGLCVTGSLFPPWRSKRSVLIPWELVSQRGTARLLFGTCFVVAMSPKIHIFARPGLANRLHSHLVSTGAA